jgi:hypothetical protein
MNGNRQVSSSQNCVTDAIVREFVFSANNEYIPNIGLMKVTECYRKDHLRFPLLMDDFNRMEVRRKKTKRTERRLRNRHHIQSFDEKQQQQQASQHKSIPC